MVQKVSDDLTELTGTNLEVFQESVESLQFGAFHKETLKAIEEKLNGYKFEEKLSPAQAREFMDYMSKLQSFL